MNYYQSCIRTEDFIEILDIWSKIPELPEEIQDLSLQIKLALESEQWFAAINLAYCQEHDFCFTFWHKAIVLMTTTPLQPFDIAYDIVGDYLKVSPFNLIPNKEV